VSRREASVSEFAPDDCDTVRTIGRAMLALDKYTSQELFQRLQTELSNRDWKRSQLVDSLRRADDEAIKSLHAMAVLGVQSLTLPLLRLASDHQEHKLTEMVMAFENESDLARAECNAAAQEPSETLLRSRVARASTYLRRAGLLESTRRGYFRITPRGREALALNPPAIDIAFLSRFPEFLESRGQGRRLPSPAPVDEEPADNDEPAPVKLTNPTAEDQTLDRSPSPTGRAQGRCRECGSDRIRRSFPHHAGEQLLRVALPLEFVRCLACGSRGLTIRQQGLGRYFMGFAVGAVIITASMILLFLG
jgi:Mrr N-terminal domain